MRARQDSLSLSFTYYFFLDTSIHLVYTKLARNSKKEKWRLALRKQTASAEGKNCEFGSIPHREATYKGRKKIGTGSIDPARDPVQPLYVIGDPRDTLAAQGYRPGARATRSELGRREERQGSPPMSSQPNGGQRRRRNKRKMVGGCIFVAEIRARHESSLLARVQRRQGVAKRSTGKERICIAVSSSLVG